MKTEKSWKECVAAIACAVSMLLLPTVAGARPEKFDLDETDAGPEIVRDATDLAVDLAPRDVDRDVADTAMVFTNIGADARVFCVGFNKQGVPVGRAWLKVPRLGLRYLLASDLSDGADFVGHAQCAAPGTVRGSAVFLGAGFSDLDVEQTDRLTRRIGRIKFLLVATY